MNEINKKYSKYNDFRVSLRRICESLRFVKKNVARARSWTLEHEQRAELKNAIIGSIIDASYEIGVLRGKLEEWEQQGFNVCGLARKLDGVQANVVHYRDNLRLLIQEDL